MFVFTWNTLMVGHRSWDRDSQTASPCFAQHQPYHPTTVDLWTISPQMGEALCTDPSPCHHPPCTREGLLQPLLPTPALPTGPDTASPATQTASWMLQLLPTTWILLAMASLHRYVTCFHSLYLADSIWLVQILWEQGRLQAITMNYGKQGSYYYCQEFLEAASLKQLVNLFIGSIYPELSTTLPEHLYPVSSFIQDSRL